MVASPDALSTLLDDVRPRGAVFDCSARVGMWSVRFDEPPPLALAAMLEGDAWITADDAAPIPLGTGDVALVIGAGAYTIETDPGAPPTEAAAVQAGECGRADSDVLLSGAYEVRGSVCDRILRGLPRVVVLRAGELPYAILDIVAAELSRPRPGGQVVLDRLLGLLLVVALREWMDRPASGAPAWYHAQTDPVVGAALQLMHDEPAHPWTVAELAARASASRSAFARRFTELVGDPPMAYLACWRLWLAADQLVQTDATLDVIARRVGYANAYALSVAFKRVYGVRPGEHRLAATRTGMAEQTSA